MAERPDIEEHHGSRRGGASEWVRPNPYSIVVAALEQSVAAFTGAPHAIAVDSCSNGLLLCCAYLKVGEVTLPARTYVGVANSVIHAGGRVRFEDYDWAGQYVLRPYRIWDAAKRFKKNMFRDLPHDSSSWDYQCISFHRKKPIPIGRGGMILTDDAKAAEWFRMARRDGRSDTNGRAYAELVGYNCYLLPTLAAEALEFLSVMPAEGFPDQDEPGGYPDLREMPAFRGVE